MLFCNSSTLAEPKNLPSNALSLPVLEYFDCAPRTFPAAKVDFIGGKELQSLGQKRTISFIQGAQFYVVTTPQGEFLGLRAKYNNQVDPEIFLSRKDLEDIIYMESNEMSAGSFIAGYRLPVFSFQLCKDIPPTPNSACMDFGYLSKIAPGPDVIYNVVKAKILEYTSLGSVPTLTQNHQRILVEKPSRWLNKRVFAHWNNNFEIQALIEPEKNVFTPVNVVLGKLKFVPVLGFFSGIETLLFKNFEKSEATSSDERLQKIDNWLAANHCLKF